MLLYTVVVEPLTRTPLNTDPAIVEGQYKRGFIYEEHSRPLRVCPPQVQGGPGSAGNPVGLCRWNPDCWSSEA